jgi:hypothetical protein
VVRCWSPWWIDYNHAPPSGAGYLSLLFGLHTRGPFGERMREDAGTNRFAAEGYPTDFTGARVSLRIRGELVLRGAQFVLLAQGRIGNTCSGWMLTGQPFRVEQEWTEQTVVAVPDPQQWTSLGTRPDRADMYGTLPLEKVLGDVNVNIYFVLFPLDVVPMGPVDGDTLTLRPGLDYHVWASPLPDGYVMVDTVRIEFR